ncbi:MAG: hypothetical protein M1829_002222 [Trizodia sp. TS-e1964]|nr:MAG: hypothetical protein M1829_002222 [Trizodia sp. TS-e1964]
MTIPNLPTLENYGLSAAYGFLPDEIPLTVLPDPYYARWEAIVSNLQGYLLSKRLRGIIDKLPVLTTSKLKTEPEWRRAYLLLGFLSHSYIWGGDKPSDRLPACISVPFLAISDHLELPPVATFAGLCLWNFKPLFPNEPIDNLDNLATLSTFSGSLDESWFYLISVAIEARGGRLLPIMLRGIEAAYKHDSATLTECLCLFAEGLDDLGGILQRMYECCDPHVFWHRIRPFLNGSKNMAHAGLPNGVLYEDETGEVEYRRYSGGSNAQSSLIQFFDIVLGIQHRPTGDRGCSAGVDSAKPGTAAPPAKHNFLQDMRSYMPGPHRRFLEHVASVANIREYVVAHQSNHALCIAYDASLAMLRGFRDKHIQIVSRYIILKQKDTRTQSGISPLAAPQPTISSAKGTQPAKSMRGTGGTALIPFLKQARDETGEPAIGSWAKRLLSNGPALTNGVNTNKVGTQEVEEIVGLAGKWAIDDSEGGLCHW